MSLRPAKWMPKVLVQFIFTKKPILYNHKCGRLSIAQSEAKVISEKKAIVSLVVKSKNYRSGIRY